MTAANARSFGAWGQFTLLWRAQLLRLLRSKRTWVVGALQLLPALVVLIYVLFQDSDGGVLFRQTAAAVTYPYLVLLVGVFYGGPTIVEEIEGRTLSYLTLRPVSKPVLYLAKLAGVITVAGALVAAGLLVLWGVSLAGGGPLALGGALEMIAGAVVGVAAYCAVFAALGALVGSSLVGTIVWAVVFEVGFAVLPVLELLSVRYYVRVMGGLAAGDRLGMLDKLILDKPLILPQWSGYCVGVGLVLVAGALGAWIFGRRQYQV